MTLVNKKKLFNRNWVYLPDLISKRYGYDPTIFIIKKFSFFDCINLFNNDIAALCKEVYEKLKKEIHAKTLIPDNNGDSSSTIFYLYLTNEQKEPFKTVNKFINETLKELDEKIISGDIELKSSDIFRFFLVRDIISEKDKKSFINDITNFQHTIDSSVKAINYDIYEDEYDSKKFVKDNNIDYYYTDIVKQYFQLLEKEPSSVDNKYTNLKIIEKMINELFIKGKYPNLPYSQLNTKYIISTFALSLLNHSIEIKSEKELENVLLDYYEKLNTKIMCCENGKDLTTYYKLFPKCVNFNNLELTTYGDEDPVIFSNNDNILKIDFHSLKNDIQKMLESLHLNFKDKNFYKIKIRPINLGIKNSVFESFKFFRKLNNAKNSKISGSTEYSIKFKEDYINSLYNQLRTKEDLYIDSNNNIVDLNTKRPIKLVLKEILSQKERIYTIPHILFPCDIPFIIELYIDSLNINKIAIKEKKSESIADFIVGKINIPTYILLDGSEFSDKDFPHLVKNSTISKIVSLEESKKYTNKNIEKIKEIHNKSVIYTS